VFTTGSKLFVGASALAVIAAVVVGVTTGGSLGLTSTIGLISAAVVLVGLAGLNFITRDGNVPSMEQGIQYNAPAAQAPAGRSVWPMAAAGAGAVLAVGAVSKPIVFKIAAIVLLAAAVEWMVQAWSERASADKAYNAGLRKRILHPLEFPLLAAAGLGLVIYSFSRIMLWVDKAATPAVFVTIGAILLIGGFLLALRPKLKTAVVAGLCTIAALGLVSTGAVAAIDGQRHIDPHPTSVAHPQICDEPGAATGDADLEEIDKKTSQDVASKAALAGTVVLENGQLRVFPKNIGGARTELTVPRSTVTNLLVRNLDDTKHRFTVNEGKFSSTQNGATIVETPKKCTGLVDPGQEALLTFKLPKTSAGSQEPYSIVVPGVEGQKIDIFVPLAKADP
jgi:hypothetical protein